MNRKNLTKKEIVDTIARDNSELITKQIFDIVQHTLDTIAEALAQGRNVELRNFGIFEVRLTKGRVGRNPRRPEQTVMVPSRATVKFKAGKVLKQRVLLLTNEMSTPITNTRHGE